MRKIIPLKDTVIMEKVKVKETSILLPEDSAPIADMSELRAILVGKDVKEIQVGDTIMLNFNLIRVETIKHEDKEYYFVREEDISCVKREMKIEN